MPSRGQFDSKEQEIDDWLKWDPISSGEGDLLLDDIEKAFSATATVTHAVNHVKLASALNSLPSHALQMKGIISTPNTFHEPQDSVRSLVDFQETDVPVAVNGISEASPEEGKIFLKNRSSILVLNHRSGNDSIHIEKNCEHLVSFNESRTSKKLDASSSPSKTELHALPSQSCSEKNDGDAPLTDDATTCRCEIDTETIQTFDELAETSLHLEDAVGTSNLEESKVQISFPVGTHVGGDNKAESGLKKNKKLPLELRAVTSNQELKESEQFQTKVDQIGSLADGLQSLSKEENVFVVDKSEQMQEGTLEKQMASKTPAAQSYEIRGESLSGIIHFETCRKLLQGISLCLTLTSFVIWYSNYIFVITSFIFECYFVIWRCFSTSFYL